MVLGFCARRAVAWIVVASVFVCASATGFAQGDEGHQGEGVNARVVASYVNKNALLEGSVRSVGVNVDSPATLIQYLDQIPNLKPGYKVRINWISPGPVPAEIQRLLADHTPEGVELQFVEFQTGDLDAQLQIQNEALESSEHDRVVKDAHPDTDPAAVREVSRKENNNIHGFFRDWQNEEEQFARAAAATPRRDNLKVAGHVLGGFKVAGMVVLWFWSGKNSAEMDRQTMAIAAMASGSGAYLAWLFTRYGTDWMEYRQNFKIMRTKVNIQWFSLISWLRGGVAVGMRTFLKVPGAERFARWFNQTVWLKFMVIDGAVRGGLGAYFRLLAWMKGPGSDGKEVHPPWSSDFLGELAGAHLDLPISSAAESSLQRLYERGLVNNTARWTGYQTWGMCLYVIQMVTDLGFRGVFLGRVAKGTALAIMWPSKILAIAANAILNQPISERGRRFSNALPTIGENEIHVTIIPNGGYSSDDLMTLMALNGRDGAIEANSDGKADFKMLTDIFNTVPADRMKLTGMQTFARRIHGVVERYFFHPIRQSFYGRTACPGSFSKERE